MASMDLNSDVGESFGRWTLGDDTAMFRSVISANLACGFHARDPSVIRLAEAAGLRMPTDSAVRTVDGSILKISTESICVHGESPGALTTAAAVCKALTATGITTTAFA